MTSQQHTLLYRFAGGESIQEICRDIDVSYADVRRWLTLSEKFLKNAPQFNNETTLAGNVPLVPEVPIVPSVEASPLRTAFCQLPIANCQLDFVASCLEFREEYLSIQKNSIPILIDELRVEASNLLKHTVTIKGIEKISPGHWQNFRAGVATIKLLQSLFNTRHPLRIPRQEFSNPLQPNVGRNPQSEDPQSEDSQSENPYASSLRNFSLDITLTPEEAEEYLGSPILLDDDYFERYPEHRQYAKWLDQPEPEQNDEKQNFAKLSANSAELCENLELQYAPAQCGTQSAIPPSAIKKIRICPQYGNQCECSSEPNSCGPAQYMDEEPEPEPPISNWKYETPSPENGFYLKSGKFIFTNTS